MIPASISVHCPVELTEGGWPEEVFEKRPGPSPYLLRTRQEWDKRAAGSGTQRPWPYSRRMGGIIT